MRQHILPSAPSTNTWASQHSAELPSPSLVHALCQPEGRGQRGNSWESEPGQNLTLSFFFRPDPTFPPRLQFLISEATALAVTDTLRLHGIEAKIKWPNDIYVGEMKICGILIEHSLIGNIIQHTIAGIGLNVNQDLFVSNAPNPVSMAMVAGRRFDLTDLRDELSRAWQKRIRPFYPGEENPDAEVWKERLHDEFLSSLWRNDGRPHPFLLAATGEQFEAYVEDVAMTGLIRLRLSDTRFGEFAFKEIAWLPEKEKQ